MSKFSAILVLATSTFVLMAFWVAKVSLTALTALQDNYSITIQQGNTTDLDRDGISDRYDDSDGDGIPDNRDATPYGHDVDIFSIRVKKFPTQ